jgi:hypothetical protein
MMRYYDLKKNWRKVRPHLSDPVVRRTLLKDLNKFTWGRWRKKFTYGDVPHDFENGDWHLEVRCCAFHDYVKSSACHWLVNFTLELANRVCPQREWRIITSGGHSTVWDGGEMLFDFNFQAFGIPAEECFRIATDTELGAKMLAPGKHRPVGYPEHYSHDMQRIADTREAAV